MLKESASLSEVSFLRHQVTLIHAYTTNIPVLEVICIEQLGLILLKVG